MIRRGARYTVQLLVVGAVVALLVGHALGQPILLGFVETGSMEPTIDAGDGFIAIPAQLTGEPEPGEVVVFEATEIEDGGLTTHRVVEETDDGYVTRGDANPFTDQESDEPPVQDGQIVASALQFGGHTVSIPRLGTAIMALGEYTERGQASLTSVLGVDGVGQTTVAYAFFGLSVVLYTLESWRERRRPSRSPLGARGDDWLEGLDSKRLSVGFAVLVVVAASAAMVVPAGTHSYDVISAEFDSEQPLMVEQGTTDEVPYVVVNDGVVPVVTYVEPSSEGVTTSDDPVAVGSRSETETAVAITAPDERGHYPTYVTEHRYLHVLPVTVIDALHGVHPWLSVLAINAVLGSSVYILSRLLLGEPDPRSKRQRARDPHARDTIFDT